MSAGGEANFRRRFSAAAGARRVRWIPFLLAFAPGCMIVDVGVTNPVPDVRTVAVVPFFNQSDERAVDGRNLAELYASELQKVPGVEVIPVGVVHTAMRQYQMQNLAGPQDAAKLAMLLNADAVVIGSVTEYDTYHPPRIGLSIAWYSPYRDLEFQPGIPVEPHVRRHIRKDLYEQRKAELKYRLRKLLPRNRPVVEGEIIYSEAATPATTQKVPVPPAPGVEAWETPTSEPSKWNPPPAPPSEPKESGDAGRNFKPPVIIRGQSPPILRAPGTLPTGSKEAREIVPSPPIRPLMTYTKVFDARDSATTAAFRDFLELGDDPRPANWTARLQWADEFPRFAMHMMIAEMFQLHGGQARRRIVFKWRKHE